MLALSTLRRPAIAAIRGLDHLLRRLYGIEELCDSERCMLRLGVSVAREDVVPADGTSLRRGDPIGELHFWNERIPRIPDTGPTAAWGLAFHRTFFASMAELAAAIQAQERFHNVRAIHGEMGLDPLDAATFDRLAASAGFAVLPSDRTFRPWQAFRAFWKSLFLWLLIWTYNPASLRGKPMRKVWRHYWLSRDALIRRHASPSLATCTEGPGRG